MSSGLRILHAIHDFLPRHQAGSEIYALELCRAQAAARHHVAVLCADYDPARRHGDVTWRTCCGIPVIEVVNNWVCRSFADTYRAPLISERTGEILDAVQPDVLHVHNLLNLSFDLPAQARARGIPVVATLHDYTLVCASGGQRIHRAEAHVCTTIDTERCARCFRESPFGAQVAVSTMAGERAAGLLHRAGRMLVNFAPGAGRQLAHAAARRALPVTAADIAQRLAAAREVFANVDLFVAPSRSIASEFQRLGIEPSRIRVSDYGFVRLGRAVRHRRGRRLRIGYVGTLVWHKGVHVLVDAVRGLTPGSYELKLFGNPDVFPDYTAQLRRRAEGLPIRFMGAFDRDRTADVYAQIDVLVVPSLWLENSPLVIHEAFMAGVPVVGARMGGITDLIADGEGGLLYDATSSTALEAVLRSLVDKPELLDQLSRRLPRVKSMSEDAQEWDIVYGAAVDRVEVGIAG